MDYQLSEEQLNVIGEVFETMNCNSESESDVEVKAWLEENKRLGYAGDSVEVGEEYNVTDPSTGEELTTIFLASEEHFMNSLNYASVAFHTWKTYEEKRSKCLASIATNIEANDDVFALIESITTAKPIKRVRSIDIPNLATSFRNSAISALSCEQTMKDFEPLGVTYVVASSFNAPLMSMCWHIASALAVGNTVILDIDASSCLSAFFLEHLMKKAGIPNGVFTVLPRLSPLVYKIDATQLPEIGRIFFCGSLEESNELRQWSSSNEIDIDIHTITCPMAVVCDPCDIHSAVEGIKKLFCYNDPRLHAAGCNVLIQEGITCNFLKKLYNKLKGLTYGSSLENLDVVTILDEPRPESGDTNLEVDDFQDLLGGTMEFGGRLLTFSSFRTLKEAVDMCNHRKSGCDVSIWCEKLPVALQVAHSVKSSNIWVNCQSVMDPNACYGSAYASGTSIFGGTLNDYNFVKHPTDLEITYLVDMSLPDEAFSMNFLSEACQMYIGGSLCCSEDRKFLVVKNCMGVEIGKIPDASPEEINNAVGLATAALTKWQSKTASERSKVLRKLAKVLGDSDRQFSQILQSSACRSVEDCLEEVHASVKRLNYWAAKNEKYTGVIKDTQISGKVLETYEPLGVIGIVCPDEFPLLSLISLIAPSLAKGNGLIVFPSEKYPIPALKLCLLFTNCGLPGGIINVVTGSVKVLTKVMSQHMDIEAMWVHNSCPYSSNVARNFSTTNQKRVWIGPKRNWLNPSTSQSVEFMLRGTYCKTIWLPMGDIFAN